MNAKNKKIIMILLTALVIAVIGGIALYMYLVPQKTTVYVFNDNYQAGTALTEKMLTPVQADSKIVVAGKNSNTSSRFVTGADIKAVLNSGDSLRMDVAEGMPLTLSILSVTGGSSVEMNMDPAKIAVTVPVTSITGVTKDLKEGSRVNIYTTGGDANGTTLLFQNMRVLSVEKDSRPNAKKLIVNTIYGFAAFLVSIMLSLLVSPVFAVLGAFLFFYLVFLNNRG